MKVSMIPNDDIVTIHASQNDGDNRIWEFEPYTNDGVIDTLGSQTIYPVYAGGTEQILPENGTAPIIADIEYPDELRTDQEFSYRQTPSTLDGNAKIHTIYGNTIINAGSLLSFNGTDIKTVGFNQWDEDWEQGAINNSGNNTASTTQIRSKGYIPVLPNTSYCFYAGHERISRVYWYDESQTFISYNTNASSPETKTPPQNARYMRIQTPTAYGGTYLNDICISIYNGTLNNQYVPYTEHTTSLPVLDRFPTGMKSAGSVYDELSDSKVVTRVGSITPTTGTGLDSQNKMVNCGTLTDAIDTGSSGSSIYPNALSIYPLYSLVDCRNADYGFCIFQRILYVRNKDCSTLADYQAWLANSPITVNYELATPTEEDFTTMSLVTQNVEIPLEVQDDKIICKCSELITQTPGFHDCKLKLTDSDGTIYSSKFKLHVERKP